MLNTLTPSSGSSQAAPNPVPTTQRTAAPDTDPALTPDTTRAVKEPEKTRKPPTDHELGLAMQALQRKAEAVNASLSFRVDKDTGKTVITVTNTGDGSVIRQIPSEEALSLSRAIAEQQGLLLNTIA